MGKPSRNTTRKSRRAAKPSDEPVIDLGNGASDVEGDTDSGSDTDASVVDPSSIGRHSADAGADDNGSGDNRSGGNIDPVTGKRKYKRRKATANPDAVTLDIGSFKDILYSTHAMLAAITSSPSLEIDEDEAAKLAKGIGNVTRHYDVPQMAQQTVDWIMLMQTAGAIYGPRLIAWRLDRAARNVRPPPIHRAAPQNVAPAPTAPNAAQPQRPVSSVVARMDDVTPQRQQPMAAAPNGTRNTPGISDLDGAGLPLKFN